MAALVGEEFWVDSETRRQNLLNLGEQNKGKINVDVMKQILDTPKDQGGATVPTTIYQYVVVPGNEVVWVKAPGYSDWSQVEYGKLFRRSEAAPN